MACTKDIDHKEEDEGSGDGDEEEDTSGPSMDVWGNNRRRDIKQRPTSDLRPELLFKGTAYLSQ